MASRDKKKAHRAKPAAKSAKKPAAAVRTKPSAKASHRPAARTASKAAKPVAKPRAEDNRHAPAKPVVHDHRAKGRIEPAAGTPAGADRKPGPKGITIVQPKPVRRPRPKPRFEMPKSDPLIKPGGPKWKPLIPSGPKAPPVGVIGGQDQTHLPQDQRIKSKFTKRELDQFRHTLLRKRSELIGDISNMEDEALRQSSGSLSHVPQHMAEQGTDTYDQGLSLDLAAVDRNLLREIDDAIKRIDQGTYGICERTGHPIKAERLQEIPWARYSIEAAREMERRPYQE